MLKFAQLVSDKDWNVGRLVLEFSNLATKPVDSVELKNVTAE